MCKAPGRRSQTSARAGAARAEARSGKLAKKLDETPIPDLGALPDVRREEHAWQWAPMTGVEDSQAIQYVPDDGQRVQCRSRASIFEHLSANCRTKSANRPDETAGWLARAAAKLLQMRHVATVAAIQGSLPPGLKVATGPHERDRLPHAPARVRQEAANVSL